MGRYIDAEKIKLTADSTLLDVDGSTLLSLSDVRKSISQTPTEDVVPVVRCRDCKFSEEYKTGGAFPQRFLFCRGRFVEDDEFCSHGRPVRDAQTLAGRGDST